MLALKSLSILIITLSFAVSTVNADMRQTCKKIRQEAVLSLKDGKGYPLPLAASWQTGMNKDGFDPDYQMSLIEKGHHLLPWFQLNGPNIYDIKTLYYEAAIKKAAEFKLPITFKSSQWESLLYDDPKYKSLPAKENPNVIETGTGKIRKQISPFGPKEPWYSVGKEWTAQGELKMIQSWYSDPPLVIFLSNNEARDLRWHKVEESQRYVDKYGTEQTDSYKRKIVGDGWIRLYPEMFKGMRDGLTQSSWKINAKFVGYGGVGPSHFARWPRWLHHSLYTEDTDPDRIDPSPYIWDGGSPSYYLHDWSPISDFRVWSPQVESMNWIFMLNEARRINPDFWFELSVWDGGVKKHNWYEEQGQTFTPLRYSGLFQFGMWLMRPKVVREFRASTETLTQWEPYFLEVVKAVDKIYKDPTLQRFWRKGELVKNEMDIHPYQIKVPDEYKDVQRWYLLSADVNPKGPWEPVEKNNPEIAVYSIALN